MTATLILVHRRLYPVLTMVGIYGFLNQLPVYRLALKGQTRSVQSRVMAAQGDFEK